MRASRSQQTVNTPPARIEMDAELLDLKAQAEGRAVFKPSEHYERIHERVNEDSKAQYRLLPSVRLKFNFYMTARRLHESLKDG